MLEYFTHLKNYDKCYVGSPFFNFKRRFFRCGHCKRLKPEFAKAASILAANDPPVALVQVDCTDAGKDTCGRFEVSGYPTVKIFRNGLFTFFVCLHFTVGQKI